MFKKGQLWRAKASGNIYLVTRVPDKHCCVIIGVAGPNVNCVGWIGISAARRRYELIGNNYQERPTTKAEKPAIDKETHNLIQNLRRDNKELRRQNKDLRDDIGDMASKLHLAYRDKFPGIAALWPTPEVLPEQRGCRKEDC